MNVGRKLVKLLEEWIELHEKMFDHSKYHEDCTQKDIEEWLAFHDKILKE